MLTRPWPVLVLVSASSTPQGHEEPLGAARRVGRQRKACPGRVRFNPDQISREVDGPPWTTSTATAAESSIICWLPTQRLNNKTNNIARERLGKVHLNAIIELNYHKMNMNQSLKSQPKSIELQLNTSRVQMKINEKNKKSKLNFEKLSRDWLCVDLFSIYTRIRSLSGAIYSRKQTLQPQYLKIHDKL